MSETTTTETAPRKTVLLRNYYERDVPVDDVTGEATIPLRIRRFTHGQLMAFSSGWSRCENPPSDRHIYRKPDEADVPMDEVRRRRLAEMTPEELAAFEALEAADSAYAGTFCRDQIREHLWVDPRASVHIEDDAGVLTPLQTGDDLARIFAGNFEMLLALTRLVYEENTLGAEKKRRLRQRFASNGSSSTSEKAAPGPSPDATAAPAAPADSASPEAASVPPVPIPSGWTP